MSGRAMRKAPAFQVYAADDLAARSYYALPLDQRGLVDAMLRVAWVDGAVPRSADSIALAVRRPLAEVRAALTPGVLAHFTVHGADPTILVSPELERQREGQALRREAQRDAAAATNAKLGRGDANRVGKRDGQRHASEKKRTEPKRREPEPRSSGSGESKDASADPWLEDYANAADD